MFVTEKLYKQCFDDYTGMFATLLFDTLEKNHTSNGIPKEKNLYYAESLKILFELKLLSGPVNTAKQAKNMTCNVKTKFYSVSKAAYSRNIVDETMMTLSEMAPAELNPQQKVKFLEVLAAPAPEVQREEGRVFWTHEAVLLLIERRRVLGRLFESNTITQRQAWRKVVEELRTRGYKYSEDDCSKKFRSFRARQKTIKEKNRQTGNSRQSWRYFDVMEDMFAGDQAVLPATIVSSMRSEQVRSPVDVSHIQVNDEDPIDELPLTSTPRVQRRVGALEALVKLLQEKN